MIGKMSKLSVSFYLFQKIPETGGRTNIFMILNPAGFIYLCICDAALTQCER